MLGQWVPQLQTPLSLRPTAQTLGLTAQAAPAAPAIPGAPPVPPEGWLDQLLAFIYTLAHWLGGLIVQLVEEIVPLQTPGQLIDPIGYLTLLTVLLLVAQIAKKLVWGIVVVGWILIGIRIALEILEKQA